MSERFRVRRSRRALTGFATVVALAGLTLAAAGSAMTTPEAIEPLSAAPSADTNEPRAETLDAWFVELKSPPAVKGTSEAKLNAEKQAFRKAAAEKGIAYTERFAFDKLWNGLSVNASAQQISRLSRLEGVQAVYPVLTASIPPTEGGISPELATAITMTGADIAQGNGYTGAGIKVAIMDTGVDYDHADLGGDGVTRTNSSAFPTSRVVAGYDLVGDDFRADSSSPLYSPKPHPDNYPDDCNGHGTHVAGIVGADAAAEGGATGVAPGVTFGAYRVFGCQGSTTADIMVAAMERALADGMDILNMSIGSAFANWDQYPTAAASNNLVDEGVVVVASIGNSGANGVWSAGAPGVGSKVIGVASFDNSHTELTTFTVTPAGLTVGYGNAAAAPPAPTSGSLPLAKTGTPASAADGCAAADFAGIPAGSAVLIRRGTCTFHAKSLNAQNAGAAAVVLYNNVAGRFSPTVAGTPAITIPVVAVSDADGVAINNAIASEPQTLNWTDETGVFANPTGGLISSFSSYGLGAELDLKPDIGAPGGLIRSTWPLEGGAYATISGTSMSSPHTAGTAALLLEAKPGLSPAEVRNRLQNTADPKPWQGNPGLGFLDQVHRQGAGMVRIDRAIDAPTHITPGKLLQGEAGSAATHTLTLTNSSGSDVTYDLSHQAALSTFGSTFAPSATTSGASAGGPITFSSASVLVPAGGTASVDVTIPRPNFGSANKLVYGGYIRFVPQGGGITLRVPYAGFGGDYQGFGVMTSGGATPPFPKLAKRSGFVSGGDFTPAYTFPTGTPVYDMQGYNAFGRSYRDFPTVAVHLDHQARWLKMTVLNADGSALVLDGSKPVDATALFEEFLPRNSTAGGFFAFEWDGTVSALTKQGKATSKNVPDGDYKLMVEVLKAGGDPTIAGHKETYTSPVFTIDRP
ncbi:MAG: S8 family serine peptidase [Gaiellaceae bacterium]